MSGHPGYAPLHPQPQPGAAPWPDAAPSSFHAPAHAQGPQQWQQGPQAWAHPQAAGPQTIVTSHMPGADLWPQAAPAPSPQMLPSRPMPPAPKPAPRLRWARLAGAMLGIALLGFATWNLSQSGMTPGSKKRAQSDGLSALARGDDGDSRSGNTKARSIGSVTPRVEDRTDPSTLDPKPEPDSAVKKTVGPAAGALGPRVAPPRPGAIKPAARPAKPAVRHHAPKVAAGERRQQTARGGGAASLPYTGASQWIAALLGITLLGAGLCLQWNAVRVGETASLYRRGPLLRTSGLAELARTTWQRDDVQNVVRRIERVVTDARR